MPKRIARRRASGVWNGKSRVSRAPTAAILAQATRPCANLKRPISRRARRDSMPETAVPAAIGAEIDRAVAALDVAALEREYWDQDEFVFLPRFLPAETVARLLEDVARLEPGLNRNYLPGHKKGGSVSHFAIAERGPSLLAFYHSEAFRRFLGRLTGAELQLCPDDDPHACALYFYTEPGDHIGFHYDTSYYRGARYTILCGLVQESSSRLQCRLRTRRAGAEPIDL